MTKKQPPKKTTQKPSQPLQAVNPKAGETMGIVSLVLAFSGVTPVAFVLGIIAILQSRKVGKRNLYAIWGIGLSVLFTALFVAFVALLIKTAPENRNDNCSSYRFDNNSSMYSGDRGNRMYYENCDMPGRTPDRMRSEI